MNRLSAGSAVSDSDALFCTKLNVLALIGPESTFIVEEQPANTSPPKEAMPSLKYRISIRFHDC
jgi:hypothetical protein